MTIATLINPITNVRTEYDLSTANGILAYLCDVRDGYVRDWTLTDENEESEDTGNHER